MVTRAGRIVCAAALTLTALAGAATTGIWIVLRSSLTIIDGSRVLPGDVNSVRIAHPSSAALPALAAFLDMPVAALPGGWHEMPRIQGKRFGGVGALQCVARP